jgi:murein DD-endopeptidase MepM/ murein hydrolase activator NlpD
MQGPQTTDALIRLLEPARSRLHLSLERAMLEVATPFPLAGPAHWSNDWHAYRPCPYPHLHVGLDLLAARGTPIVSVANASVTGLANDPEAAGLAVEITDGNGTSYFYAHMERRTAGLRVGLRVRMGQVIGFVGNTGNAAGGPTHLHFEVQPHGVPVPPKPYVDRWLLSAEAKAKRLVHRALRTRREERTLFASRPTPYRENPLREGAWHAEPMRAVNPGPVAAPTAEPWPVLLANEASRFSGPVFVLVLTLLLPPAFRLWRGRRRKGSPTEG